MNRLWKFLPLLILIFVFLVYHNYIQARNTFTSTKNSVLSINMQSFPASVKYSSAANFSWNISSTKDFKTNFTTIFYGYTSTPSALTIKDSPSAVGYPYLVSDYLSGTYSLPDAFNANVIFNKFGRVWFRAYAKVGEDHLWSEEKYLDVTP